MPGDEVWVVGGGAVPVDNGWFSTRLRGFVQYTVSPSHVYNTLTVHSY